MYYACKDKIDSIITTDDNSSTLVVYSYELGVNA